MRELNNPDSHLEYIINDCEAAISANPLNPKTEYYLTLARACQAELIRRQNVRIERKQVKYTTDMLAYRHRCPSLKGAIRYRSPSEILVDQAQSGALAIGLRKLHLTKGA